MWLSKRWALAGLLSLLFTLEAFCAPVSLVAEVDVSSYYEVIQEIKYESAVEIKLQWVGSSSTSYGTAISPLNLRIEYLENTAHIKFTDAARQRWEVPNVAFPIPTSSGDREYTVSWTTQPFSLTITRNSNKDVMFSSTNLIFTDQYLEFGTKTPKESPIYGLAEFVRPLRLDRNNKAYTLFNSESYSQDIVAYGSHPFYLEMHTDSAGSAYTGPSNWCTVDPSARKDCGYSGITDSQCWASGCCWSPSDVQGAPWCFYEGSPPSTARNISSWAHGVFLLNSNPMDVVAMPDAMYFKPIGGILDMYVFAGPTPADVVQQYHRVIGAPSLPPRWSLGFHQSRYGYKTLQQLKDVVASFEKNALPLDTIWVDIDYMQDYKTFTLDSARFPQGDFLSWIKQQQQAGRHLVMIVDPGVKVESGYGTYDRGMSKSVFIRDHTAQAPQVAKMWPGLVVHPDFTNPSTYPFWRDEIKMFHDQAGFDGLWLDVNEITSFCDGRCVLRASEENGQYLFSCKCNDVTNWDNKYDEPPYWPGVSGRICRTQKVKGLDCGTLSMASKHYGLKGYGEHDIEYNWHNLFGNLEANATATALAEVIGKRPFVLCRATYPGAGRYTAHWTGDNYSTHRDLMHSVSQVLAFNLMGMPNVGADVCGFHGDTTTELCARWMQLGALAYPFYRNHNGPDAKAQEPYALGDQVTSISRESLRLRYGLLSYLYTQMWGASQGDGAVVTPLWYEFPHDASTYNNDRQFMLGPALLVSPALAISQRKVNAYFPAGQDWYDFYSGAVSKSSSDNTRVAVLDAPLEVLPIHVRAGSIVPTQEAASTTQALESSPMSLIVALHGVKSSPSGAVLASGSLFLDDGTSVTASAYTLTSYTATKTTLGFRLTGSAVRVGGGSKGKIPDVTSVRVFAPSGVECHVASPSSLPVRADEFPALDFACTGVADHTPVLAGN
eukprot:TRINITY_DN11307_c0_g1::TRINITY_DN11307_c0_g1_i1::g.745::m.745 TRINITY_DN11307_c0_g1::TRINITY_DN11307_c0_g1_i1::g.745  ORF type:complete len:956 (+),score=271.53,sp/O04893/AGLU_SPIOL/35.44/1e-153,Glyco_hydro_31/PF01055.21/6.7e-148,Trefoil/PF00088.13/5.5e-14,Trefoil/PF00088.13/5.4e+03,Gal_mutarotas_2/PF13802.1/0.002,Gal_mutarotas_2/PF13802.1/5.1e+03,Gal_mutarotas_2/PF13802.1/7.8e+03 TRINITY_DN11307_c0_g1_i1:28-2868(+)